MEYSVTMILKIDNNLFVASKNGDISIFSLTDWLITGILCGHKPGFLWEII
jgi:hypothetical protein